MRQRLVALVDHPRFANFITAVIAFNAVILGLETSQTVMQAAGPLIITLEQIDEMFDILERAVQKVQDDLAA